MFFYIFLTKLENQNLAHNTQSKGQKENVFPLSSARSFMYHGLWEWAGNSRPPVLPRCSMVPAFGVSEIGIQKHVFVDSANEAIHIWSNLSFALNHGDHDVKSFCSVSREISPKVENIVSIGITKAIIDQSPFKNAILCIDSHR